MTHYVLVGYINSKFDNAINAKLRLETGTATKTMTSLLANLSAGTIYMTSTELVSDKPDGKYGVIVIFKFNATRAAAICLCTDGAMYVNAYNASTSKVTGWSAK